MSARDHDAYRERMRAARTEEERQRIREEYDARMRAHGQRGWRNSPPGGFPGNRPDMP